MIAALRLAVIALATAAGLTAAQACNETCTTGFAFDDNEGVCVRVDAVAT